MHKKIFPTSLLLSILIATTLTPANACDTPEQCEATTVHCCLGIRQTEEREEGPVKTGPIKVQGTTVMPPIQGRVISVTTNSAGERFETRAAPEPYGTVIPFSYESSYTGPTRVKRMALSADGLFCGFLGWLNLSRYCKNDPCQNVDQPEDILVQRDSCCVKGYYDFARHRGNLMRAPELDRPKVISMQRVDNDNEPMVP